MPENAQDQPKNKIIINYGETQLEGALAGLTIFEVKVLIAKDQPQAGLPFDAVAMVSTMDGSDPAWRAVASEQKDTLIAKKLPDRTQLFQAVAKVVPETYVLREADIFLQFDDPPKAG